MSAEVEELKQQLEILEFKRQQEVGLLEQQKQAELIELALEKQKILRAHEILQKELEKLKKENQHLETTLKASPSDAVIIQQQKMEELEKSLGELKSSIAEERKEIESKRVECVTTEMELEKLKVELVESEIKRLKLEKKDMNKTVVEERLLASQAECEELKKHVDELTAH